MDLAFYGPAAKVGAQIISYLLPQYKVAVNGVAGALVTVVIGIVSLSQGLSLN